MCPQYRQRQTSELNEQGKNDIPVRCQGAYAKSRRFLEILQNILISKLSLFYMHFSCQNTGTYSLKSPLTRVNSRFLRQQAYRLDMRTNSNYVPTKLWISGQYFYSTNTVRAAFSHKIMDGTNFAPY